MTSVLVQMYLLMTSRLIFSVNLSAGLGLEKVIIFGNATSNVVEFNNATGFVTSSNVGIANASATHTMDIGSNVFIDDVGSNVLYVRGNIYSDIVTTPKLGVSKIYLWAQIYTSMNMVVMY